MDPRLSGSIQHQWKHGHTNTEPEQMWRRFRRMWAPGFEALLEEGVTKQWYNVDNIVDRYVPVFLDPPSSRFTGYRKGLSSVG
jgi:hypothetical protein